jgi:hypothetical protein
MLKAISLFALPLIAYNLMLFGDVRAMLASDLFVMVLPSQAQFHFTLADLFLVVGVFLLFVEILKATRTSMASVADHAVSTLVFVVFVIEFITVEAAGTATFLILGLMSLLDVVAGFTVTIAAARRDFAVGEGVH